MEFKYTNRIVAYIDVLGWKEYINDDKNDPNKPGSNFLEIERILKEAPSIGIDGDIDVKGTQLSDSIIISMPAEYLDLQPHLVYLFNLIYILVKNYALKCGLVVRGAVTMGNMIHLDNIVYGVALNDAFNLEKCHAIYPRIIIDEKLFKKSNFQFVPCKFSDEYNFFHFLDNADIKLVTEFRELIIKKLDLYFDDKIRKKYLWLANYFNANVNDSLFIPF